MSWNFNCPYEGCGEEWLSGSFLEKPVVLGPGKRICRKCKREFNDNSREWPELTALEQVKFLIPQYDRGWMFFIGVILGVFAVIVSGLELKSWGLVVFFFIFLLPQWIKKGFQIFKSRQRTKAKPAGNA